MRTTPVGPVVYVRRDKHPDTNAKGHIVTAAGIHLSDDWANREPQPFGVVVALGIGPNVQHQVKVGDRVVLPKNGLRYVTLKTAPKPGSTLEGEDQLAIVRDVDLLGVVVAAMSPEEERFAWAEGFRDLRCSSFDIGGHPPAS